MNIELSELEARILGCLIEKQLTTPDQYPLSLNALTNACNQKSNRDPVMALDERTVQTLVEGLVKKHYIIERSGFGSRVPKYQQLFCNSEFGSLKFTPVQLAIVVELLLRGPQTPGELRTRAPRMCELKNPADIETALQELISHSGGALIVRLARESGRRDHSYAHLFCGQVDGDIDAAETSAQTPAAGKSIDDDRLTQLEALVEELRLEISQLKQRLGEK